MTAKLPVGVIGLGRMGEVYTHYLAMLHNAEIIAVSDVNEEKVTQYTRKYGVKFGYTDYHELLGNPAVAAVMIVSPTSTHAEIIIAAAEAGKAIFSEKPISLALDETDDIIATIERTGVFLQVGFMRRFDPGYMAAKEKLDAGIIGEPTTFKSIGRDPFCPPLEYARPEKSGGLILDMGIHDFDLGRWLMKSEVARVYSEGGTLAFPQLNTVGDIDNAVINMKFESGALGNVEVSRNALYGYDIRTEILGTEGGLNIGYYRQTPVLVMTKQGIIHDMVPYLHNRFGQAYLNQTQNFVENVLHDRPPAIDARDARASLIIGLAATKSFHEERPVRLEEYS